MIYIYMCVCRGPKCARRITWPNTLMLKVSLGRLKQTCDTRVIHYNYYARAALAWTKKKRSFRNEKLKARQPTLKRWKRGDDNELESNLRLEKVVASEQLRLAMETEDERRARLENDAATKRLRLVMETEKEKQDW